MKNRIVANLALLAALTGAGLCAGDATHFKIPFAFHVGNKVMPAGSYDVSTLTDPAALVISCFECKKSMVVLTNGISLYKAAELPTLQFQRYGEEYFLEKYLNGPLSMGRAFYKSKAELEIAKRSTAVQPDLVAVKAH